MVRSAVQGLASFLSVARALRIGTDGCMVDAQSSCPSQIPQRQIPRLISMADKSRRICRRKNDSRFRRRIGVSRSSMRCGPICEKRAELFRKTRRQ